VGHARLQKYAALAIGAVAVASLLLAVMFRPSEDTPEAEALFHIAVIDEMMSGVSANPAVQYVEINMLSTSQNFVQDSHLSYFAGDGSAVQVLLIVPSDVLSGNNRRWIMAANDSTISGNEFRAAQTSPPGGIDADFYWDPSVTGEIDPTSGMICWGAPDNTGSVPPPASWDENVPGNYIDCFAYGGYGGNPAVPAFGSTAASGPGNGTLALQRTNNTQPGSLGLACPTPQNNANLVGDFGTCPPATPTPTPTVTATPTPTPTPTPCASDPDSDLVCDPADNCPDDSNPEQQNTDAAIGNGPTIMGDDTSVPWAVVDSDGDACEDDGDVDGDVLADAADGAVLASCGLFDGTAAGHANPTGGDITGSDGNGPSFDTDGDHVADGIECAVGLNPRHASAADRTACAAAAPAGLDSDGDGLQNAWEFCNWLTHAGSTNSDLSGPGDCQEAMDVNGSGTVNNSDAVFISQAFFMVITGDWNFDINGSGSVNNNDAVFVKQAFFAVNPCL
jgi:hypothetical protein